MAATTAQPMGNLPSGLGICTTAPDIFYLPEMVSGRHSKQHQGIYEGICSFFDRYLLDVRIIWFLHFLLKWTSDYHKKRNIFLNVLVNPQINETYTVGGKVFCGHMPDGEGEVPTSQFHSYCICATNLRKNVANYVILQLRQRMYKHCKVTAQKMCLNLIFLHSQQFILTFINLLRGGLWWWHTVNVGDSLASPREPNENRQTSQSNK